MAVNDDDERRGPLGTARALLGKVVDKVVDAAFGAEPRASSPPAAEAEDREPIPTRTMAGLLVSQGHRERALAIYDHLIEAQPDDAGLKSEAEALRNPGRSTGDDVPGQEGAVGQEGVDGLAGPKDQAGSEGEPEGEPAVVAVAAGRARLLLSWRLSDSALDRARQVLGSAGELRARVMVTATDLEGVVSTEAVERRGVEGAGEWVIVAPPGALCTASVGVAAGARFVSAAHAPTVTVTV